MPTASSERPYDEFAYHQFIREKAAFIDLGTEFQPASEFGREANEFDWQNWGGMARLGLTGHGHLGPPTAEKYGQGSGRRYTAMPDPTLNEEERMLQTLVRDFADRELAPRAREVDEKEEFDWELGGHGSPGAYRHGHCEAAAATVRWQLR